MCVVGSHRAMQSASVLPPPPGIKFGDEPPCVAVDTLLSSLVLKGGRDCVSTPGCPIAEGGVVLVIWVGSDGMDSSPRGVSIVSTLRETLRDAEGAVPDRVAGWEGRTDTGMSGRGCPAAVAGRVGASEEPAPF